MKMKLDDQIMWKKTTFNLEMFITFDFLEEDLMNAQGALVIPGVVV